LLLSGIASIVFSFLLMLFPAAGALGLLWIIASYAIIFGAALAQRRHLDRKNTQPVVQVFPEASCADRAFEVVIAGYNHAHVGAPRDAIANRLELALLENTKQLGLHFRGQITHLIQKRVPPSAN